MRKNLLSWLLYDAGNSFIEIAIGSMFLGQWLVVDNKLEDIVYATPSIIATVLVLVTAPFWGAWSDAIKKRVIFLKWFTLALLFCSFLLAFLTNLNLTSEIKILLAVLLAFLLQYFYQLSLVPYNALVDDLDKKRRGFISGFGQSFNNFGWIVAMGVLLFFAKGHGSAAFWPAFIGLSFLTVPLVILYKERPIVEKIKSVDFKNVWARTTLGIKSLFTTDKNTLLFLIGFSFASDAIITIGMYFAIVMNQLFKLPDAQKFYVLGIMQITMIIACYVLGKICDRSGAKKIVLFSLFLLVVIFLLCSVATNARVLYLVALAGGIGWGGFYTASRVMLLNISPVGKTGEYFGFYSTFQRFASIFGPAVWSIVTLLLTNFGPEKYRFAVMSMVFLMTIGTILIAKVRISK